MISNPQNPLASQSISGSISDSVDDTLQLIARLPAPAGLEDRVYAALQSARRPQRWVARRAGVAGVESLDRVLAWPKTLGQSDWVRTAAAAAIVFVVAGGGWGVYTHVQNVQNSQPAKVIVMPRGLQPGGFSGAGAMRTPQTLPGPTVTLHFRPKPAPPRATRKHVASNPAADAEGAPAALPAATASQ